MQLNGKFLKDELNLFSGGSENDAILVATLKSTTIKIMRLIHLMGKRKKERFRGDVDT